MILVDCAVYCYFLGLGLVLMVVAGGDFLWGLKFGFGFCGVSVGSVGGGRLGLVLARVWFR